MLVTANLNANGKAESYGRTKILDVKGAENNLTITCLTDLLDNKRQPQKNIAPIEYTVKVADGAVLVDMSSFFKIPDVVAGVTVTFSGDTLRLPSKIKAGETFKDLKMTVTMDMGAMKMPMDVAITNYKCVAVEKVTVPAGTFEAYKTTYAITTSNAMMNMKETTTVTAWNVLGIGQVKTLSTDSKGNVETWMELQEIK
ncbi:hypothetical protein R80B4_02262 [Fibrobacteres bacterium R8-0-B4]